MARNGREKRSVGLHLWQNRTETELELDREQKGTDNKWNPISPLGGQVAVTI